MSYIHFLWTESIITYPALWPLTDKIGTGDAGAKIWPGLKMNNVSSTPCPPYLAATWEEQANYWKKSCQRYHGFLLTRLGSKYPLDQNFWQKLVRGRAHQAGLSQASDSNDTSPKQDKVREVIKKRIFCGQADRKKMWKIWPIFFNGIWLYDTQNTYHLIVRGLKNAFLMPLSPLLYCYLTLLWQSSSGSKEELGILLVG